MLLTGLKIIVSNSMVALRSSKNQNERCPDFLIRYRDHSGSPHKRESTPFLFHLSSPHVTVVGLGS